MRNRLAPCLVALAALLLSSAAGAATSDLWPLGADVSTLSEDGSAVGPLDRLRVSGKYTVFDIYAVWCTPCRLVDHRLREIVAQRRDVAVRKLNVVSFGSPLAAELGPAFDGLPFVVVFTPQGRRFEIMGADFDALDTVLGERP